MLKIKKSLFLIISLLCITFGAYSFSYAQEFDAPLLKSDVEVLYKAKVLSVGESRQENIPGTDTKQTYQEITFTILNKDKKGTTVTVDNDYTQLSIGDSFYVKYQKTNDGEEIYTVSDPYRLPILVYVFLLFVFLVVVFGGKQGVMSLLSLVASFGMLFYILFPGILAGYNPVLISGALAVGILFFVMYLTHGFTRMTTSAFLGCMITILITIGLSYFVVLYAKLTGFTDDEAIYLNFNTSGSIDFKGLLLGAIIIGVIGIIDDIAITQASVVSELKNLSNVLSDKEIFAKAIRIGKDHTGAVVNSLVLAYTGASLPLLLLIYTSTLPVTELLNSEVIATEIIRTLIGSIGLVLAVPITTYISVILIRKGSRVSKGTHSHG